MLDGNEVSISAEMKKKKEEGKGENRPAQRTLLWTLEPELHSWSRNR
jgi:hypothetical protein